MITTRQLRLIRQVAAAAAFLSAGPSSRAQTWLEPGDPVIARKGAEDHRAYAHGRLGVVLSSYGRKSLYEAYRVLNLPVGQLTNESMQENKVPASGDKNQLAAWLAARAAAGAPALQRPVDYYKRYAPDVQGVFGNCGASAFELAVNTLSNLRTASGVSAADLTQWIAAQDAVFDRCAAEGLGADLYPMPAELPFDAPALLRGLRQYQRASAAFYAGDFSSARAGFELIANDEKNPMHNFAALASLRSSLREASLNLDWQRTFDKAYTQQGLRGAALQAVLGPAGTKQRERNEAAARDIETRLLAYYKDPRFKTIQPSLRELYKKEMEILTPVRAIFLLMTELDHLERNPYADRTLEHWAELYQRSLPERITGPLAEEARKTHPFFDWQLAVQACTDGTHSVWDAASCTDAHQRSVNKWRETGSDAWLLAAVMSLRAPADGDQALLDAALAVPQDKPAAPSLQFHVARTLLARGDTRTAAAIVDQLAKRHDLDRSASNLLGQFRFQIADSIDAALSASVRTVGLATQAIGADGAELIDWRMSSAQLLALSRRPDVVVTLQDDMMIAAWFRAHLLKQEDLARQAAADIAARFVSLRPAMEKYRAAASQDARSDVAVQTLLAMQISPQVHHEGPYIAGQVRRAMSLPGSEWCGFNEDHQRMLRAAETVPALSASLAQLAPEPAEIKTLQAIGSGPQWFAHEALASARRNPKSPATPSLLRAVIRSTRSGSDCPAPDAKALGDQAQLLLKSLG